LIPIEFPRPMTHGRPNGIMSSKSMAATVNSTSIPETSDEQGQIVRRHSALREFVAFLLVLIAVAFVVYGNAHVNTSSDFASLHPAVTRFRVMILIETVSIRKQLGATRDKRFVGESAAAVRLIEEDTLSPEDKFHAAISAGEIIGKERALADLD